MNCEGMPDDELEMRLWLNSERMWRAKKTIRTSTCETEQEEAKTELIRVKQKIDLISVEILYRTSFRELEYIMDSLFIDYTNTVNPNK